MFVYKERERKTGREEREEKEEREREGKKVEGVGRKTGREVRKRERAGGGERSLEF